MKLSEVLYRFYVLPLGQSEIVGYDSDENDRITITWKDADNGDAYFQEFKDQDIVISSTIKGMFAVRTIESENVAFIALDGVDLKDTF